MLFVPLRTQRKPDWTVNQELANNDRIIRPRALRDLYPMATVTEVKYAGATGFPNFPRLPLELRTEIWEMALDYPRVVTFVPARLFEEGQTQRKSLTPSPALLCVCSESRSVARNVYVNINKNPTTTPVYVNPDIDKVYVSCWSLNFRGVDFKDLDLGRVKSLAVMYEDVKPSSPIASLTDMALVGWRPEDNVPFDSFNESVLGSWGPGSPNILQEILRLIKTTNAKEVAEVAILGCPPLTQRPNPCQTHIRLVASQLNMRNQQRPAYADLERALGKQINGVPGSDGIALDFTIHPSADGRCRAKFRSYFVKVTPWSASQRSEDYPSGSLSGVDGDWSHSILVREDMPSRRPLTDIRLYESLDVPRIESPKVTAVNVPTREGYKWWIVNRSQEGE